MEETTTDSDYYNLLNVPKNVIYSIRSIEVKLYLN
jgi:hypothetical protein